MWIRDRAHLGDRAVDVRSSGEKQRAAIASVYAMKPKVFVCDEPTANLDAAGTRQLTQTLRQLKEQGFTLLLAEHRIDWLMGIADRLLYLRDGRIAAEYTPEDLLRLPEADILGMGLRSPHEGKCPPSPSVLDESPAVLKTAGLSKRIRTEVIFEDISLSVPEGGVTAITGQNGAGKTKMCIRDRDGWCTETLCRCGTKDARPDWPAPVSYTHLDVYKRQCSSLYGAMTSLRRISLSAAAATMRERWIASISP